MARELVPLKVKILLKPNGNALYPDFNKLQIIKDSGMDWSFYIDIYSDGMGWHYDKTSGHLEETSDSPVGQQFGVLLLPDLFVKQAVAMFPNICSEITELECEKFYDEKAHVKDADEIIDNTVLESIKLKQELGLSLTKQQRAALDPNNSTPGIIKNKNKKWTDHKTLTNITIKQKKKIIEK